MASFRRLLTADYWEYPQTWYFMPRWKPLRKTLQWLHGILGHMPSKTEWGYGGGTTIDTWCRWCDKVTPMPMETARFYFPRLAEFKPALTEVRRNTSNPQAEPK